MIAESVHKYFHSDAGQAEIAALVIMIPGAAHRITFHFTFDDVMDGLAIIALGIKFHHDRPSLRFE